VELIEDENARKKIIEKLPFLHKIMEKIGLEMLMLFCLKHGTAAVWTRQADSGSKQYINI